MKSFLVILIISMSMQINAATFSADRIEEACRTFLIQKYGNDYQIDFLSKFTDINVGDDEVKAVFDEQFTAYNNGVKLQFVSNNKVLKSQIFHYIVKKEIGVYKAKTYIPTNTDITSSMLIRANEFVELDKIDNYINPVGRVATKSIYQGESLTSINTLPDVTVKRGEEIVVIATNGAVTIRGLGTALQDGRAGDSIKVKRGDSKKILTGKLNESGELILGE